MHGREQSEYEGRRGDQGDDEKSVVPKMVERWRSRRVGYRLLVA